MIIWKEKHIKYIFFLFIEQIINTIEDNTLLLELLKPNEFNVIERLSGLVQDAVLKDLIQLVLKTNDSDLRNRLSMIII